MSSQRANGATRKGVQASHETDLGASREADRVYADLRNRILTLDLVPGSVLDEARIVQDTGVSRTPVREAVIRLVSEGLLRRDGRQVMVPAFQIGQLRAFFEAMHLLSRATHRMAADRRDDTQLAAILSASHAFEVEAERGDPSAMNDANYRFHLAISDAADNTFIQESYQAILIQSLRLSRQCFVTGIDSEYTRAEHVELILRDHAAICDAVVGRRPAEADKLAADHCDLFRNRLHRQLLGPSPLVSGIGLGFEGSGEPSQIVMSPAVARTRPSPTRSGPIRQKSVEPT